MSVVDGGSTPPPGWEELQSAPVLAPAPVALAPSAQPAAEAAVRWRIGAAVIDNLLVYAFYLLVCLLLGWRVYTVEHLWLLLVLDVAYHFSLESRDGQTVGKRRYGIRVVSVDGHPAEAKAIAVRSVLRIIDSLPFWYLSGLVSMVRTGPERRQRIGDVVADTKVVAVSGNAANSGSPRWLLPTATLLALVVSVVAVIGIAEAGHQPLTGTQQAEFVAGCDREAGAVLDCGCLLNRLEADGYTTLDSLRSVMVEANAERINGQSGAARTELTSDALNCRR